MPLSPLCGVPMTFAVARAGGAVLANDYGDCVERRMARHDVLIDRTAGPADARCGRRADGLPARAQPGAAAYVERRGETVQIRRDRQGDRAKMTWESPALERLPGERPVGGQRAREPLTGEQPARKRLAWQRCGERIVRRQGGHR